MAQPAADGPVIAVIGVGAIGAFVGVLLHEAGFRVRFLARQSERWDTQLKVLSQSGLVDLCSTDPDFRKCIPASATAEVFTTDPARALSGCTCVLVATKRTANVTVHRQLLDHGVKCPVVFLQNGLRIREDLGDTPYEAIEAVVNFNTVYNPQTAETTLSQPMEDASLVLDGRQPSAGSIAKYFDDTPLRVKVADNHLAVQAGKLVQNMANAVNALSGVGIGPMLNQSPYRLVYAASITEAKAVFAAAGIAPEATEGRDKLLLRIFEHLLRSPQWFFTATVGKKLKGRGDGMTSMAQDLNARRVPTEIEFLNGEISRMGRLCGVPTPVNDRLIELVHEAEKVNSGCPCTTGAALMAATGVSADSASSAQRAAVAGGAITAVVGAAVVWRASM